MQKKLSNLLKIAVVFTLCCSITACKKDNATADSTPIQETQPVTSENENSAAQPMSDNKSLYAHGMDIIALMEEMVQSDYYLDVMSGSDEIETMATDIAKGAYTSAKTVYEVTVPSFDKLLALLDEDFGGFSELSPGLQEHLNNRSASSFLTRINANEGVGALATSSVFTAGKVFVNGTLTENTMYLYTFESGYPIAICFSKGVDGAVSASGTFLLSQSLSCETAEDIEDFFRDIYITCTVEEIEKK